MYKVIKYLTAFTISKRFRNFRNILQGREVEWDMETDPKTNQLSFVYYYKNKRFENYGDLMDYCMYDDN